MRHGRGLSLEQLRGECGCAGAAAATGDEHALRPSDKTSLALVRHHAGYVALGLDDVQRWAAYGALFGEGLDDAMLAKIRLSINGGWVLGNDRFAQQIADVAQRRTAPPQGLDSGSRGHGGKRAGAGRKRVVD